MKKQTAVDWIVEQMAIQMGIRIKNTEIGIKLSKQSLEMERQQIIDAVDGFPIEHRNLDGSDYYTQTFTEPKKD
jgi:hypothetical protein